MSEQDNFVDDEFTIDSDWMEEGVDTDIETSDNEVSGNSGGIAGIVGGAVAVTGLGGYLLYKYLKGREVEAKESVFEEQDNVLEVELDIEHSAEDIEDKIMGRSDVCDSNGHIKFPDD